PSVVGLVALGVEGPSGVHADPDVRGEDLLVQGTLHGDGGLQGGAGVLEGREEAVTGLLDHLAAGIGERGAQELVVTGQQPAPLLVPEALRALLESHRGNVAAVGRELGKARMQIHRWMRRYGIDVDDYRR